MKSTGYLLFVFFLCILMQECTKTDHQDMPPQLKIVVKDAGSTPVSGANVKLYLTADDFQLNTNAIDSASTVNDGSVIFTNLEEINYFFYVESNGKTNHFGVAATSEPLEKGYVVIVETIIE